MNDFKLLYSGIRSGKTNAAAMNLAELTRKYTSITITVVSEEMKDLQQENTQLRARVERLEKVRDLAEDYVLVGVPCREELKSAIKDCEEKDEG